MKCKKTFILFAICILVLFTPIVQANSDENTVEEIEPMSIESKEPEVEYQGHIQNIGWQKSVKNGELSGTEGRSLRIEALKIKLNNAPENVKIKYQTHVQNIGWQNWVEDGELAGTEGKGLRLEAIKIELEGTEDYSIMYRVHIQNIGWQEWKTDGELAGTEGKSLRIEAIEIKIVEKQKKSWIYLDTATNGTVYYDEENIVVSGWKMANISNTKIVAYIDNSKEPIDEQLIKYIKRPDVLKEITEYGTAQQNPKPGFEFSIKTTDMSTGKHTIKIFLMSSKDEIIGTYITTINIDRDLHVSYASHVQGIGWQSVVMDGKTAGTEGRALRVEALKLQLINAPEDAKIKYKAHVQNIGWQDWVENGELAGTEGQALRIEAIQIELENMDEYTVEYRVHVQNVGWTEWYIDGETAGTVGKSKRIEAIQIRIVPKYKRHYIGVDVSYHQKEIDFDKMVASNQVDFMIARAGWYSESQSKFIVDAQFERNYKEAKARNIPLGTYIYSYATSVDEAKREARGLINYLKSTNQTDYELPIFFDVEDKTQENLGKETLNAMIIAFGEEIKNAGYNVGVYANLNWFTNYIDISKIPSEYALWIARHVSNTSELPSDIYMYAQTHDIWQYTSSGKVDGISTNVDMNICYRRYF